jgi:two-component system, NtrC family, response regulator HydG
LVERILIVDDAADTLEVLERNLTARGYDVTTEERAARARERLSRERFDLVITDLRMPDGDGMEIVRLVREQAPDTEVMMITGYATIQGAVDAVKTGAAEYLAKPFTKDELYAAVSRSLGRLRAVREARGACSGARFSLIGDSNGMRLAFAAMTKALAGSHPVVFAGEPGSGRWACARALANAAAPAAPFVTASAGDPGFAARFLDLCRQSAGGFLVVRDLELAGHGMQKRLAAGGGGARLLLIASPLLETLIARGLIRQDPVAGLGAAEVRLPPLRERGGDVTALAEHFAATLLGGERSAPVFGAAACRALAAYPWPGNVAELRHAVAQTLAREPGVPLEPRDLPDPVRCAGEAAERTLDEVVAAHIRLVLAGCSGNKSRAAEILGINRKTLAEKLRSSGGERSSGRPGTDRPNGSASGVRRSR